MSRPIVLTSPLAPRAIAEKLRTVVGARDKVVTAAGVTGQGSETDMRLFYYRPRFQNAFMTSLVATIEPDGAGARITGRIGPPGFAMVFLGCWFGFLLLFLLIAVGAMAGSGALRGVSAVFLLVPLGMMAIGGLIAWVGLRTRQADEAAILAFLAANIGAREVTS